MQRTSRIADQNGPLKREIRQKVRRGAALTGSVSLHSPRLLSPEVRQRDSHRKATRKHAGRTGGARFRDASPVLTGTLVPLRRARRQEIPDRDLTLNP